MKRILLQTEHRELNIASGPAVDCAWHFTSGEKSSQSVPCFRIYRHQDFSSTQSPSLEFLLSPGHSAKGQRVNNEQTEPHP